MTEYAVELIDVSKQFRGPHGEVVDAVKHMFLNIRNGEFFSLLGPSGCGKTTTLRMVAGFEMPTSGEIRIHGELMGDTPPFHRKVNTVFQNYALFPHMTVFENVAFGLQMEKVPKAEIRQRVREVLRLVQLPGMEDRRPQQLSGGQQQRVALARALVKRPKVLLLDEPLGALDLKLRKAMQLELKHIQHEVGITFIYVTHDQEEALTMSDRIAVMNQGEVLQVGAPAEIYEAPATRFVADFIGETNFLAGRVESVENGLVTLVVDDQLRVAAARGAAGLSPGQAATFAVRPEKIAVQAEGEACPHCVPGRVEEVVYSGTDTRYVVRVTDRSTLVARVQNVNAGGVSPFQTGDGVYLSWDPTVARILVE